ncbi:MAG: helix-turn-helix transcriptional regulator [Anaerolineales bacterium]
MPPTTFSRREREVIELLLQGKSNKQIAAALHLSGRTVEFHLSNIYAKLGVASRTEAVLKLSAADLRESAGGPARLDLRPSAVEKADETSDNGSVQIRLRRKSMKTMLRFFVAGIPLAAAILACAFLARLRSGNESARELPPPPTATSATPQAAFYQRLSPSVIVKDDMLFEAGGHLTCTELTFNLNGTFPEGFASQFPNGEIPPLLADLAISAEADGVPLELEAYAGGGGGGESGAFEVLGQGRAYRLLTPIEEGQQVHVTALVTFGDYIGIPEPVAFELDLWAADCATATSLGIYEYPAPDTIVTAEGVVITVSPHLSQTDLTIDVESRGPMAAIEDELRERPTELYVYTDLQIEFPDPQRAFQFRFYGGGGGGPGEGDTFQMQQGSSYRILSPLRAGEVIPIILWITFDPFTGITEPVPFVFDLTVTP